MIYLYKIDDNKKVYFNKEFNGFGNRDKATNFQTEKEITKLIARNNTVYNDLMSLGIEYSYFQIHISGSKYKLSATWYDKDEVDKICNELNSIGGKIFEIKEIIYKDKNHV